MNSRLVLYASVLVAIAAVVVAAVRLTPAASSRPPAAHASLPPQPASYLGVYEDGAPPGYQPIAAFSRAAGQQPNLAGYFSGWAEPFDVAFADGLHQHGVIPFVQIDPTFASVAGIAAGSYNAYLSRYAASVRDYGHPVVIGFGHEMNAPTYSWGYGRTPAATFAAAWRHIVTLFRAAGADNVTWLWTINADRPGTGPVQDWWPGAKYVTWVGIDGYYYRPSDTFASVFGTTMSQVRAFTRDPILLSETAVGPRAHQYLKIGDLFSGMSRYQALGLVWFDKTQDSGIYHQDWRLEDSGAAEAAFRLGVAGLNLVRPQRSPAG
jgi:mannan endo-1,4-beta-mannosidase